MLTLYEEGIKKEAAFKQKLAAQEKEILRLQT